MTNATPVTDRDSTRQPRSRAERLLFLVLAVFACAVPCAGSAVAADVNPRHIVAEFEVAPDGDTLRIPVTIGTKEYSFLVNTALITSTIDVKLREELKLPKLQVEVRGKRAGPIRDRFGGLQAVLRNVPFEFPGGVETADYSAIRDKFDLEIHGEIGMDLLQRFVVQIDFDEGVLRFLSSLPPSPGEPLRITPLGGEVGAPTVPVSLPGKPAEKFVICTGRAGNSLGLRSELFSQLEQKGQLQIIDKERGTTRSGGVLYEVGRLNAVQIGRFRHEELIVNAAEQNDLGLSYLARYLVTFDFPHAKMYLKKGAHFDDPDGPLNLWEAGIGREGDRVVVREVGGSGTARRLGLRAGDRIESLNGCPVTRLSIWQVRRLLGREGRSLTAVVRRGTEQLTLATDPPTSADDDK